MIRTKEDFKGKNIYYDKKMDKETFGKVINKLKKFKIKTSLLSLKLCSEYEAIYLDISDNYAKYCSFFLNNRNNCISIEEFLEEETMTSGYLYIDPKDMEKSREEARKNGIDIPEKSFTITTTPCPKCGFSWNDSVDWAKNNINERCGYPIEFSSPFKGLDFCYRNPNKEIEVYNTYYKKTYKVKYDKDLKRIVWFGDYAGNFGIERKWRVLANMTYVYNWKNIKEYKSISSIEMTLEEAVKSGLRFGFNGETWRTSPKGFILDSKGNSLKSNVLLNNLKTKVKIIEN